MEWARRLPLFLTFSGLLLLASVAGFQDSLVYQPPSSQDIPHVSYPHESVFIDAKDGVRLNLVLLRHTGKGPAPGPTPTIIFFHGNAVNIGLIMDRGKSMLYTLKVNVVLLDYRGYGQSEGEPSEEGLHLDAEAALDYVMNRTDLDKTKVILFGRSLGGAVAVRLASENPDRVAALVLENTFFSIRKFLGTYWAPLSYLPLWMIKNKFPSNERVAQCRMPTLFLSGQSDELISPDMMQQLYELSPSPNKRMVVFPTGKHDDTWLCTGYFDALEQFIKDLPTSHAHQ